MMELIATSTFGLEAVVRREIEALGYEVTRTSDGRVTFLGDERAVARANLWLRAADRVLLKMGEFPAIEPDDLFNGVKEIEWEKLIPEDGEFIVNCSTVRSRLRSEPNNQKTVKKAVAERLGKAYSIPEGEFLPETGERYMIKVSILSDIATLTVDTSGEALHKRGYRVEPVAAPIKETMAAALVELSFWKPGRALLDPCCGSGTIPIEAALIEKNIAPGFSGGTVDEPVRRFAAEEWGIIPHEVWDEERKRCLEARRIVHSEAKEMAPQGDQGSGPDAAPRIAACDVDPRAIKAARANAGAAGVQDVITFMQGDIGDILEKAARTVLPDDPGDAGIIITNPPYGERISEKGARHKGNDSESSKTNGKGARRDEDASGSEKDSDKGVRRGKDQIAHDHIFDVLSGFMKKYPRWSVFLISPDKRTEEKVAGRRADRRRKLFNGNIEVNYYQFHGLKPEKR